jgi:hypothetical protein
MAVAGPSASNMEASGKGASTIATAGRPVGRPEKSGNSEACSAVPTGPLAVAKRRPPCRQASLPKRSEGRHFIRQPSCHLQELHDSIEHPAF